MLNRSCVAVALLACLALPVTACGDKKDSTVAGATTTSKSENASDNAGEFKASSESAAQNQTARNNLRDLSTQILDLMGEESDYRFIEVSAGGRGLNLSNEPTGNLELDGITFTDGETDSAGPDNISVQTGGSNVEDSHVVLSALSKSGTCFFLRSNQLDPPKYARVENSKDCNSSTPPADSAYTTNVEEWVG